MFASEVLCNHGRSKVQKVIRARDVSHGLSMPQIVSRLRLGMQVASRDRSKAKVVSRGRKALFVSQNDYYMCCVCPCGNCVASPLKLKLKFVWWSQYVQGARWSRAFSVPTTASVNQVNGQIKLSKSSVQQDGRDTPCPISLK